MRRQENFDIANIGSFHGDRLPTHSFSQTCVPNFFTPSTYRSRFSQPAYAQQKIQRLDSINNNNNWMYFQDIPKNFNFGAYAQSLTDIGFTFDPVSMLDLQYVGDTPSEALQRLRKLPVVISDCKESLIILNHCILMDHVGGEKYNHIIQKFFNGKISFSINFPIVDSTSYQQYQYNLLENKQGLGELTVGDQVYLLGRAIGYGVKPTSESNAYNLVVVGYNDNGEPLFKGFRSHDNRVFTYQVMINHFDKVMRRPLTIGDVYHLVIKVASSPNDRPDFSPLTWQEIFNTFDAKAKLEMSSIVEQYEKFSGNTMARYLERKKATTVCVPESLLAQPALGLVQVERFNEAAFVAMCQPGDAPSENASHNTVRVSAPAAMHKPADDDFQDESYQVDHDFQLELYSVFKRFCSNVIRQSRQSFDGLFVYGDAGTGKTHLSQTAVAWLKSKGLKVLEFTFSQSPLSEDFYIKLLESSVKANGLYDETPDVMAYLETHYNLSQHDIIYIDDANKKLSKLSTVTKALLHYASQQGKIILVNSNQSPEEMLPSSFTERVSRIRFHEVRGSDYRQSQAWYKQVDVERLQSSDGEKAFIMNENLIATEPQMTIKFWVEKLMQQDKSSGLVIAAPPGTGKSTVLKHILPREKTLYLLRTDLVVFDFSRLNQMKVDVLVIEDINDISWRSGDLSKVFNCICNAHEQALKNKHGQPIRIIITSNNNEIDIATANRYDHNFKALVPRMVSRFSSRFHTLKLEPTYTDLRAKQSSSRIHFVRSIESQKQSLSDGYLNVKKFYDTLLVFSASQAYSEQGKYRREFNLNASQRSHVTVDFSALSLRSINNFNFIKNEFFRLIDLMEDKLKTLTCVHSDPEALYCKLQSIIEETFVNNTAEAQRYLSRLNNNACIESPLLSQSLS